MSANQPDTLLTQLVLAKLTKMLGEVQARALADEIFHKVGAPQLQTPDQMKQVANELIARGGLPKMIGHSIMVEALLRGAKS
jgi:hypothetical protein